ncbi:MAG TPA: hypothetical protein VNJ11_06750 [Bryobacteraceae bacterium]|nr:hypothetical protein [Bryobacteraceae bacterium]
MGAWLNWFLVLAAAASDSGSASVRLSPQLARWKAEIETQGQTKVVLARVYTDAERNELVLPPDTEARPVLSRFFLQESFREQFVRTHAMSVTYSGAEGRFSFVVLNMALASEWEQAEEAVIAHEFGHAWLAALGYGAPPYEAGERSCLAVHAGDIVQHVLIREEMDRRGIAWRSYWVRNLNAALERLESQAAGAPLAPCQMAAIAALWADTRLGFSERQWGELPRFLSALEEKFPAARLWAERLVACVSHREVRDRAAYHVTLGEVSAILAGLWDAAVVAGRDGELRRGLQYE